MTPPQTDEEMKHQETSMVEELDLPWDLLEVQH